VARRASSAASLAVAMCALAAPAGAATADGRYDRLVYAGAPGEANDVVVTLSGDRAELEDRGAVIDASGDCEPVAGSAGHRVSCVYHEIHAALGDGPDRFAATLRIEPPREGTGGYAGNSIRLDGGPGDDQLAVTGGQLGIHGGDGDDRIEGTAMSFGGSFSRTVTDGSGNVVESETYVYGLYGDAGDDTIVARYTYPDSPVVRDNPFWFATILQGGPGADTIDGTTGMDRIDGGEGGDTIRPNQGQQDEVAAGPGDDRVVGGDIVHGDDGADELVATEGAPWLFGDAGDDTIDGGGGIDDAFRTAGTFARIDGGRGADVLRNGSVSYEDRTSPVTVIPDGLPNDGEAGEGDDVRGRIMGIRGGSADDVLTGTADNNEISGGAGNDVLTGAGGVRDVFFDGRGDDTIYALDGGVAGGPYVFPLLPEIDDEVFCGEGRDTAFVDADDASGFHPPVRCDTVYVADALGNIPLPDVPNLGSIPLPVRCPAAVEAVCAGRVEVRLAVRKPLTSPGTRPPRYVQPRSSPRLGTAIYKVKRKKTRRVSVKLTRSGRQRLKGRKRVEAWITFSRPKRP
jgi:Ca2+-binding RTX toxin-like protein